MENETKVCPNCKRDIPALNLTLHIVRCAKSTTCAVCKEPVVGESLQAHMKKHNKLVKCAHCQNSIAQKDLEKHQLKCDRRVITCQYCELELPQSDMEEHTLYCGSRTEQCPDCNEWVMFKYKQLHLESNHTFLKLDDEPGPIASWEQKPKKETRNIINVPNFNLDNYNNHPNAEQQVFSPYRELKVNAEGINKNFNHLPNRQELYDVEKTLHSLLNISEKNDTVSNKENSAIKNTKHRENAPLFSSEFPNFSKTKTKEENTNVLRSSTNVLENEFLNLKSPTKVTPTFTNLTHQITQTNGIAEKGAIKRTSIPVRVKRKAPLPPVVNNPAQSSSRNSKLQDPEVLLPCELCNGLFNPPELLKHQESCEKRNRLSMNFNFGENRTLARNRHELIEDIVLPDEIQLPCEFCSKLFSPSRLLQHQNACDDNYIVNMFS